MKNICFYVMTLKKQRNDKRYDTYLRNEQRNDILIYGMTFCKKRCRVVIENLVHLTPRG